MNKTTHLQQKSFLRFIPFALFYVILTWLVRHNAFFWDTIQLGSKHAHWFYQNNFRCLILPESFDSGHIPGFGMYLALVWKIFGKSLPASHFAMLPFLLGIVWQAKSLINTIFSAKHATLILTLLLADATLLTQSTLISPDVLLVFFFLASINTLLQNKRLWFTFSILGLSVISMRGTMCVVAIYFWDCYIHYSSGNFQQKLYMLLSRVPYYLPAFVVVSAFLLYHYMQTGWIGYHSDSPWAESFKIAGIMGVIRNFIIVGWRFVDFGRIFLWIFLIFAVFYFKQNKIKIDENIKRLAVLWIALLAVLTPNAILRVNLSAHRYFLPLYLVFTMVVCYILFVYFKPVRIKRAIFAILLVGLLSGNIWMYPDHIAKGWDATLAHLPYYSLRKKSINYLKNNNIELNKVGSDFPNLGSLQYIDLCSDTSSFVPKNFETNSYILTSNIFNNAFYQELEQTDTNWELIKNYESWLVYFRLYRKVETTTKHLSKK